MSIIPQISSTLKRVLGAAIILLIVLFLAVKLQQNWAAIPFTKIKINYGLVACSFLILVVSYQGAVLAWQRIIGALGGTISYRRSWWVLTGSYLAKYIPGHVWAIGSRIILSKGAGIPEKISGTGVILEMIAVLLGSLLVFFCSIPWLASSGLPPWVWLLGIAIPILSVAAFTPVLPKVLQWLAARFLKREIQLQVNLAIFAKAFGILFLALILQGIAFYTMVCSLYSIPLRFIPNMIGIYNGAWALGFLSFITPGGLGVREGAMVYFMKSYMPLPMAIILAAVARLWITIFEIMMALVGLYIKTRTITYEKT